MVHHGLSVHSAYAADPAYPALSPMIRRSFLLLLVMGLLGVIVVTGFGTRWPSIYYMTGPSMEPTISAGTYFLAWSPPKALRRGQLVLFRFVDDDGVEYEVLRRIAGLAGDTIGMHDGRVLVNGQPQEWPYRIERPEAWRSPLAIEEHLFTWGPWIVPQDSLVLLSDARDMTGWPDSRFIGFIGVDQIVGTAMRSRK